MSFLVHSLDLYLDMMLHEENVTKKKFGSDQNKTNVFNISQTFSFIAGVNATVTSHTNQTLHFTIACLKILLSSWNFISYRGNQPMFHRYLWQPFKHHFYEEEGFLLGASITAASTFMPPIFATHSFIVICIEMQAAGKFPCSQYGLHCMNYSHFVISGIPTRKNLSIGLAET